MIKGFPKILLPLFLIFVCFIFIMFSGLLELTKEDQGHLILILVFTIFYILTPIQVLFFVVKIIKGLIEKLKNK